MLLDLTEFGLNPGQFLSGLFFLRQERGEPVFELFELCLPVPHLNASDPRPEVGEPVLDRVAVIGKGGGDPQCERDRRLIVVSFCPHHPGGDLDQHLDTVFRVEVYRLRPIAFSEGEGTSRTTNASRPV